MNRRTFTQTLATAAIAAAVPSTAKALHSSPDSAVAADVPTVPYGLSVMLWTVFKDQPTFEDRMARVVESGYKNIQLVGEYRDWKPADFERCNAARKRLGVQFDTSAGLHHGVGDPSTRDAFLADLKEGLGPMEKLECPAMIVMSGNVVPGMSREAQHQSCIDGLKEAAKVVEGKTINGQPVRLLLECIHLEENPKYFLTSANEAIEIIRAVNHPQVRFLYDIYHEQMSYGDLISKIEKHVDVIGLIHVADVPGRHQPGTGEINYGNIYKKLAELGYKHNIAMEFVPVGDQVAALKAAKVEALNPGKA